MTDETQKVESLVLEQLRQIRSTVSRMADDIHEIKGRIGHLEEQSASMFGVYASVSTRLDKFGDRLERIEKRLELVE